MEKLKIYICTHTGFECPVSAPVYEVIDARDICGDVLPGSGLPGAYYSELATYRHMAA